MGLLKHLLFWPVTGPAFLTEFSLGKVADVVREELTDDSAVKTELYELQLRLELGDIGEDEYAAEEARIMQRLRDIREWRERFGMGVSGGLVRVADASGAEVEEAGDEHVPGGRLIADISVDDVAERDTGDTDRPGSPPESAP